MSTPIDPLASNADEAAEEEPTITNVHERRRKHAPAALFVLGLAMVLFGGILTIDAVGPTTTTPATITEVDFSSRKGRENYTLAGTDSGGGTFRMDTTRDVYRSAQVGDEVTVHRALVTSRVVRIDGPGWSTDSGVFVIVWLLVAVLGVAAVAWAVTTVQRQRRDHPEAPTIIDRTKWALPVVVLATVGWMVWERSNASGDAPASVSTSGTSSDSSAPIDSTPAVTEPTPQGCDDLSRAAEQALESAIGRGFVDAAATRSAFTAVAIDFSDCERSAVEEAVCTKLAEAAAADTGLVVFTEGLCPDLG